MFKKIFLSFTVSTLILVPVFSSRAFASTYGSGAYNTCGYGTSCPTPAPTPTPSPTPTPTPTPSPTPTLPPETTIPVTSPASEVQIKVKNIDEDKPVSKLVVGVEINIEKINSETKEKLELDDVGWVSLYAGEKLVGTDYNVSEDGDININWDVKKYPSNTITVIVFSKEGEQLARESKKVTFVKGIQDVIEAEIEKNNSISQSVNNQAVAGQVEYRQVGFLSNILGDTGSLGDIGKVSNPIKLSPVVETTLVSFPFWLFLILFAVAIRLLWQASREVIAARRIQSQLLLEKDIVDQKMIFISLASHYLNTPFTLINSAVDMFESVDRIASESLVKLKNSVSGLQQTIAGLIDKAQKQSTVIAQINTSDISGFEKPVYKSASFFIPVLGVGIIILIINLLLQIVTTVSINGIGLLVQFIVLASIATFLLLSLRNFRLRKKEKQIADNALSQQLQLDTSKNEFISDAAAELEQGVNSVIETSFPVQNASSYKYLDRGVKQFQSSIYKFELANKVEKGAVEVTNMTTIDINEFIDGILTKNYADLTKKKIQVNNNVPAIKISKNLLLFGFLLDTVVGNAIKFNKDGGQINIDVQDDGKNVHITVADSGIGIAKSKLDKIFDPFYRATSVTQFDYEGMGFSLYLSHLIAKRLGGELSMSSEAGQGTTVYITVPKFVE